MVSFDVIDYDLQMILKNIYSVHKRFNDVAAEERIVPIAFCKPMEEEQNTVAINQLRLGITERFNRDAESIGGILQNFQLCGGG